MRRRGLLAACRPLLGAVVAAAAALVPTVALAHTGDAPLRFDPPTSRELALRGGPVRDRLLTSARAPQARLASAWWGGRYTTSTGESVVIYTSEVYAVDENANQTLANFLAGLVHGTELSRLTVYVAPLLVLQTICGSSDVAGCYSPSREVMVVPGEDLEGGPTVAQVVTHEYGHHVATNRINTPWPAVEWGTKRWASYVGVCARAASGELVPGDEGQDYALNPGEGFAEAYRVLNEVRAGATSFVWPIVDDLFFPDQTALEQLALDVTEPWTAATATSVNGRFSPVGPRTRRIRISTPLDGNVSLTLRPPGTRRYRLELLGASGAVLARGATVTRTVCGSRTVVARVTRIGAAGPFTLHIVKP